SGMVGISFAAAVIWGLSYALDMNGPVENFANPSVSMSVVFIALVILVVSGWLAGLIAATSATKMKPVDALRMECNKKNIKRNTYKIGKYLLQNVLRCTI